MIKDANYILYFGANLAPRLSMFALLLVLTRLLPVSDYGLFVLVVVTGEILDMSMGGWVRLFVLSSENGARRQSAGRFGRTLVLTSGACAVALIGALVLAMIQPDMSGHFTIAVMAYVAAFALLRLGLTLLQTQENHAIYAVVEIVRAVLSLALAVGAGWCFGSTFLSASLGVSIGTLVAGMIACTVAFRRLPRPSVRLRGYASAFTFGLPIITVTLLGHTMGWFDRFILNYALGPASVGLYAAAFSLARQPVELFSCSLNPYTYPMLVRSYATEGRQAAGIVQAGNLLAMVLLCGAVTVGIALLAKPFAELTLPEAYQYEAVRVMPWIAFATLCSNLKNFIFDNAFYIARKNWDQFICVIPPAIVSVAFGLLLIPEGGPRAAALVAVMTAVVALSCSILLSIRHLPFSLPGRSVVGLVVSTSVAALALVAVRTLLADYPPLLILLGGSLAFVLAYAGMLSAFGFSLIRMLDRPWEVWQTKPPTTPAVNVSESY